METKENLTRDYIFKSFKKLLETKSFDEITVSEITEKAGVSRMSFYRNFKSKEDLTLQGLGEIIKKVEENIKQHGKITFYAISKELFEETKKYQNIFHSLEKSPITKQLLVRTMMILKNEIPIDYMNKTMKYIPMFYFGAISVTMFDWLKGGAEESPEEMARMIASLINFDIE